MADIRFEKPETTEQFATILAGVGILLPVSFSTEYPGQINDAAGDLVAACDLNGELSDELALKLAAWIVTAINTCGGFVATRGG